MLVAESIREWQTIVTENWDKEAVCCPQISAALLDEETVWAALTQSAATWRKAAALNDLEAINRCRLFVENASVVADLSDYLPSSRDGTMRDYCDRLGRQLGGRKFGLVVRRMELSSRALYKQVQSLCEPIIRKVGQHSCDIGVFLGNYPYTGFGVHRDHHGTLSFVVSGRKRLRFWPALDQAAAQAIARRSHYDDFVAGSTLMEAEAGGAMYWPQSYHHVAENPSGEVVLSVNCGLEPFTGRFLSTQLSKIARHFLRAALSSEVDPVRIARAENGEILIENWTSVRRCIHEVLGPAGCAAAESMIVQMCSSGGYVEVPSNMEMPAEAPSSLRRFHQRPGTTIAWLRTHEDAILVGCDSECALVPSDAANHLQCLCLGHTIELDSSSFPGELIHIFLKLNAVTPAHE